MDRTVVTTAKSMMQLSHSLHPEFEIKACFEAGMLLSCRRRCDCSARENDEPPRVQPRQRGTGLGFGGIIGPPRSRDVFVHPPPMAFYVSLSQYHNSHS